MSPKLLPCPFCGPGQSIVSLWHDDMAQRWRVGCGRCGASSGISPRDKTEAPAIAAWNNRRPDLDRMLEIRGIELSHQRRVNDRLIRLLASIHMRCAPPDTKLEDGRVMRFVPPDPEFYWRELSTKVARVEAEMRAINQEEDAALRVELDREKGA